MERPSAAGNIAWFILLSAVIGSGVGCAVRKREPYTGPTEPIDKVIGLVNQNSAALPTLFARTDFKGDIVDPQTGRKTFVSTEGELYFRKPRELLMRGKKPFAGEIFELGSTQDRYWLTVFVEQDTQWWGFHKNNGKPCAKSMPIRPDMIGEVLGISQIDTDLLKEPVPVMQFNNNERVYMFRWNARKPDRWFVEKEVWYDYQTFLPRAVCLLDENGRVIVWALIRAHAQVEVKGVPQAQWPRVGTSFDLFMPDTGTRIQLTLSGMALTSKTGAPRQGTIQFPEESGVTTQIQIDEDCN